MSILSVAGAGYIGSQTATRVAQVGLQPVVFVDVRGVRRAGARAHSELKTGHVKPIDMEEGS
jgi:UDP-glucose 4-epimerase